MFKYFLILFLILAACSSETEDEFEFRMDPYAIHFIGNVGEVEVRMYLYLERHEPVYGSYTFVADDNDHWVEGAIDKETELTLTETDSETGALLGKFICTIKNNSQINGSWVTADSSEVVPVSLKLNKKRSRTSNIEEKVTKGENPSTRTDFIIKTIVSILSSIAILMFSRWVANL